MEHVLTIQENEYQKDEGGPSTNREVFESNLASHIKNVWERNKKAKLGVERRFIKSLRQRNGQYDPDKLRLIKLTEGSEMFSMLTSVKCRAAEAWINEAYTAIRGRTWTLEHTPVPELNPAIVKEINERILSDIYNAAMQYKAETGNTIAPEEFNHIAINYHYEISENIKYLTDKKAKDSAEKMQLKIDDQLEEGAWNIILKEIISDVVTFGTGILKSPVIRNELKHIWLQEGESWRLDMKEIPSVKFERISPFDLYPEDDAANIQDGDLIERMRMTQKDVYHMIGLYGFNDEYIKKALDEYSEIQQLPSDTDRAIIEGRGGYYNDSQRIEILNFWGSVKGKMLLEWGIDEYQIPDENDYYDINAWLVNNTNHVIKVTFNKMREKPYSKICFEKMPGSFWGKSLPEIVRDDQDMCNSNVRAIQNNEAYASIPMSQIDIGKVLPGSPVNKLWAGRIFQTDSKGMKEGRAVEFYQPPSILMELLAVFEKFSKSMDEKSGIPAFAHGSPNVGGLGNTSSGLSMFISMGGKIISDLVENIDKHIVATTIKRLYDFNMMYDPDESIKGDLKVKVRGVSAMVAKEQEELRKNEFLRDTNNPVDLQIMGIDGRKELLKQRVLSFSSLDVKKIIPEEKIPYGTEEMRIDVKGKAPAEKPPELDVAGNRAGGMNQFMDVSKRGTM